MKQERKINAKQRKYRENAERITRTRKGDSQNYNKYLHVEKLDKIVNLRRKRYITIIFF